MKKITANDAKTLQIGKNKEVTIYTIERSKNGNPRAVVHFIELGLKEYGSVKGLRKYRGKNFGGGYVLETYDFTTELHHMLEAVEKHKAAKAANA